VDDDSRGEEGVVGEYTGLAALAAGQLARWEQGSEICFDFDGPSMRANISTRRERGNGGGS
jgi:hypothetical protein